MPAALTYPGVYVEEIPSGVHTITGVATSITAFIGRALRGPTDDPMTINSYGDFERIFGGLWADSTLGYAVRDFFLNGGSQAIIVRLYHPKFATPADQAKAAQAAKDTAAAAAGATAAAAAAAVTAKANTYAADPEKSVAKIVAAAATPAAGAGATVADVTKAAKTAAAAAAAGAAATAANETAAAAVGPNAAAAAAAAATKAATYPADPEKSAAKAVSDAAATAAGAGATPADVADAATTAAATAAPTTNAKLSANGLWLMAKYEGSWGNTLRARIDHDVVGTDAANLFNLSVYVSDGVSPRVELFRNVSVVPGHVRQVDKVLENDSSLVNATGTLPAARPNAHADPDPTKNESDVWADNSTPTNSKVADADKASDGSSLDVNDFTGTGKDTRKEGLYALKKADLFNILCIPPYLASGDVDNASLVGAAAAYCEQRRAMFLVDPPSSWSDKDKAKSGVANIGTNSKNAALFFPRLTQPNPLHDNQMEDFVPCGAVAGVFARTDTSRGVWKAPAGLEAALVSVPKLNVPLNDPENGELNPLGINCLRAMPAAGRIVWGSRTLQGDDRLASEWKYIPVRRTALYIEESLYRGTQWVVFEPNDEPLWAQIRLNVGAFMHNLFRQGAFQGTTPREAYFVKCDKETTTQNDIDNGIVNIVVGFAPLKPAEFVVIKLQQIAGQIAV